MFKESIVHIKAGLSAPWNGLSSHVVAAAQCPLKYKQHAYQQLSPFVLSLRLYTLIPCDLVTMVAIDLWLNVVPARISSQSRRHCWRSPLPHASALIQRDFGCILGVQQTKQLPHVTRVDLVWQLEV
ncbi:hypothetical protein TNCV_3783671 [Trichonephila clavipes]|nr:hypothetical protein TNCV_3783671 [Trichonephila clavipes]